MIVAAILTFSSYEDFLRWQEVEVKARQAANLKGVHGNAVMYDTLREFTDRSKIMQASLRRDFLERKAQEAQKENEQ